MTNPWLAFEVALGRGRRERAAVALLHALAGAALGAWAAGWLVDAAATRAIALVAAGGALLGGAAGWGLHRPPQGRLAWDGRRWQLRSANSGVGDDGAGSLRLMIDAGAWMLLRFRPASSSAPACWFGVGRSEAGAAWPALRAAVYCPATDAAAGTRPPPPDRPA